MDSTVTAQASATKLTVYCYPGFEFINANNKFLGCYKNLSDDACRRSKDPSILYRIVPLENMWWTDYPYLVVPMEKEDCGKSCLKDCNCGALLYKDHECTKYKLPLRYGRVSDNMASTAFFKVMREDITIQDHNPPVLLDPKVLTKSKSSLILILSISLGSISCFCVSSLQSIVSSDTGIKFTGIKGCWEMQIWD